MRRCRERSFVCGLACGAAPPSSPALRVLGFSSRTQQKSRRKKKCEKTPFTFKNRCLGAGTSTPVEKISRTTYQLSFDERNSAPSFLCHRAATSFAVKLPDNRHFAVNLPFPWRNSTFYRSREGVCRYFSDFLRVSAEEINHVLQRRGENEKETAEMFEGSISNETATILTELTHTRRRCVCPQKLR